MAKAKGVKTRSISFRVPAETKQAIQWGKKITGENQSNYITGAVTEFLDRLDEGTSAHDLMLPEGYEIPNQGSKMVTIRIDPDLVDLIQRRAPRLYQSMARLILWSVTYRSFRLAKKPDQ